MSVIRNLNELRSYAYPAFIFIASLPTDSSFQYIINTELFTNLPDRFICVFVMEGTGTGNDSKSLQTGKSTCNFLSNTISLYLVTYIPFSTL